MHCSSTIYESHFYPSYPSLSQIKEELEPGGAMPAPLMSQYCSSVGATPTGA
jgi:hypothetical protein